MEGALGYLRTEAARPARRADLRRRGPSADRSAGSPAGDHRGHRARCGRASSTAHGPPARHARAARRDAPPGDAEVTPHARRRRRPTSTALADQVEALGTPGARRARRAQRRRPGRRARPPSPRATGSSRTSIARTAALRRGPRRRPVCRHADAGLIVSDAVVARHRRARGGARRHRRPRRRLGPADDRLRRRARR